MKYNLHTHSFYCNHGSGEIQDYVDEARKLGLEMLGFSEHSPFPDRILEDNNSRMSFPQKPFYEEDVRKASKTVSFPVLLGYECDVWPGEESYLKDLSHEADFLIFGLHFLPGADGQRMSPFYESISIKGNLKVYSDAFMRAVSLGIFSFAAHPDVFMCGYPRWDEETKALSKDIIQASIQANMPLEVNANGIDKSLSKGEFPYRYPNVHFWEMARDMGASCVCNMDAHTITHLSLRRNEVDEFCTSMNLKMAEPSFDGKTLQFN